MIKIIKNPLYTGIAIFVILVVVVAWVWDDHKNPSKDFYGMLKPNTPKV